MQAQAEQISVALLNLILFGGIIGITVLVLCAGLLILIYRNRVQREKIHDLNNNLQVVRLKNSIKKHGRKK